MRDGSRGKLKNVSALPEPAELVSGAQLDALETRINQLRSDVRERPHLADVLLGIIDELESRRNLAHTN